jgi:hypothetical protein
MMCVGKLPITTARKIRVQAEIFSSTHVSSSYSTLSLNGASYNSKPSNCKDRCRLAEHPEKAIEAKTLIGHALSWESTVRSNPNSWDVRIRRGSFFMFQDIISSSHVSYRIYLAYQSCYRPTESFLELDHDLQIPTVSQGDVYRIGDRVCFWLA